MSVTIHPKKISEANAGDLRELINGKNKSDNIFKGGIGINDIENLIDSCRELSSDIQY